MAILFSRQQLSATPGNGRGIKVVATASAGTTIHTATSNVGSGQYDEIWLEAYNSDTVARLLTIQFGGTTSPDDDIKMSIDPQVGLIAVINGLVLANSLVVKAYAAAANVITLQGFVNRMA